MCSLHSTCYDLLFPICACFWIGDPIQANLPKEIADYLNKMGARIPNVKPGKATIEYLTKIQASTRFWGTHLPLQVIYLMNNYNLELYLFLFFFFGMGGSCRRSIVECIGNYINHSWSFLASDQWGICNWVYIGSNYRECQLTPYDYVLFTWLCYFRLFDDGIAPWRHDRETKTPKGCCHCVNNLSIMVVCTTVIFCTSPNVFAFIGGPGGFYYWTKEILSSI